MKRGTITSESFISDDGRLGIYMEMEGSKVASLILAKKTGPKVEFKPEDLRQLAEIAAAASIFLDKLESTAVG